MATRIVTFLALVFTALALVPYGAHLFSLPNKIGMTQEHYFIAQRAYDNWALMSLILFPALLFNIMLAVMLYADRPAFFFAAVGCAVMASTLVVFFAFTYPGNVATQNWTVAPADWEYLRTRWEYSHAANAVLALVSFCCIALAAVLEKR